MLREEALNFGDVSRSSYVIFCEKLSGVISTGRKSRYLAFPYPSFLHIAPGTARRGKNEVLKVPIYRDYHWRTLYMRTIQGIVEQSLPTRHKVWITLLALTSLCYYWTTTHTSIGQQSCCIYKVFDVFLSLKNPDTFCATVEIYRAISFGQPQK